MDIRYLKAPLVPASMEGWFVVDGRGDPLLHSGPTSREQALRRLAKLRRREEAPARMAPR